MGLPRGTDLFSTMHVLARCRKIDSRPRRSDMFSGGRSAAVAGYPEKISNAPGHEVRFPLPGSGKGRMGPVAGQRAMMGGCQSELA